MIRASQSTTRLMQRADARTSAQESVGRVVSHPKQQKPCEYRKDDGPRQTAGRDGRRASARVETGEVDVEEVKRK
jgi:hypothetical protein